MKNFLSIFLLVSIIISTNACSKDICNTVECLNGGICVEGTCDCPEGFSGDNCEINLFDVNLQLHRVQSNYDTGYKISQEYFYDSDGNISRKQTLDSLGNIGLGKDYYVINDTIFEDSWRDGDPNKLYGREKFYYLNSSTILREYYYFQPTGIEFINSTELMLDPSCGVKEEISNGNIGTFDFYDENCSYSYAKYNDQNQLTYKTEFQRDNKNNPYRTRWHYFEDLDYGNETLIEVADIAADSTGNTLLSRTTSSFTYNENGYPETEIKTQLDGSIIEKTYIYY